MKRLKRVTLSLLRTCRTGLHDGWEQPRELSMGMTYRRPWQQELYDRAVNIAQVSRLFFEVVRAAGRHPHDEIGRLFTTCLDCEGTIMPGVLIPMDFSDREDSKDGKVFVARCDTCRRFESDVAAAEAVSRATGWTVHKSFDRDENVFEDGCQQAIEEEAMGFGPYYRPYFKVTMEEASRRVG